MDTTQSTGWSQRMDRIEQQQAHISEKLDDLASKFDRLFTVVVGDGVSVVGISERVRAVERDSQAMLERIVRMETERSRLLDLYEARLRKLELSSSDHERRLEEAEAQAKEVGEVAQENRDTINSWRNRAIGIGIGISIGGGAAGGAIAAWINNFLQ